MSNFNSVKKFMLTFGQEVKDKASFPNDKIVKLRKANEFPYAGGLMGLTHKKYLDQIIEINGKLCYPEIPNPRHKKRFIEFEQKSLWSMIKTFFLYNHYFLLLNRFFFQKLQFHECVPYKYQNQLMKILLLDFH